MAGTKKTDLYSVHDDLSEYFQLVLDTHLYMVKKYREALHADEIGYNEFKLAMAEVQLAPAVLTCIATFLKTNDIMVITNETEQVLENYAEQVEQFKKNGTSISALDHTAVVE